MWSYVAVQSAYSRGEVAELSAHEALSLVEFQLRLVAFIAIRGFFLKKLRDGAVISPVIEVDNRLPNDNRLRWARERPHEWQRFVAALESSEAARVQKIAASGSKAMARVRFKVSLDDLADASSGNAVVRRFWEIACRESR